MPRPLPQDVLRTPDVAGGSSGQHRQPLGAGQAPEQPHSGCLVRAPWCSLAAQRGSCRTHTAPVLCAAPLHLLAHPCPGRVAWRGGALACRTARPRQQHVSSEAGPSQLTSASHQQLRAPRWRGCRCATTTCGMCLLAWSPGPAQAVPCDDYTRSSIHSALACSTAVRHYEVMPRLDLCVVPDEHRAGMLHGQHVREVTSRELRAAAGQPAVRPISRSRTPTCGHHPPALSSAPLCSTLSPAVHGFCDE
jgi:hypothetical protein